MIGFYSPSFRKRKVMRRHKVVSLLFLLASTLCLILALAPIPSPFGTEMGNSIALTCLSAFLSVAMVEGLEYLHCCHETIEDAWRRLFRLYDYAYRSNWSDPAPWYFNDSDMVSKLIREANPTSVCIPGIPRKTDTISEYCKLRAMNDEFFSNMTKEQQLESAQKEIERWVHMMDAPIEHYWSLRQSASEYIRFSEELYDLPFFFAKTRSLFLEAATIAKEIESCTNLHVDNRHESLGDSGWGSKSLNYLGLKQCDSLFGKVIECTFQGVAYRGDVYQQKLYSCIDRLFQIKMIYKPEDDAARIPWGGSTVPSEDYFSFTIKNKTNE